MGKSKKKGFGIVAKPGGDWADRVRALQVPWFYSWGGETPVGVPSGVEFVPMVWGWYGRSAESTRRHYPPRAPHAAPLLGFNEPDGKEQANLSVEAALAAWPTLMETGRRLGSPAAVHADKAWMTQFMAEANRRKYRVDFITVHWYAEPKVSSLMAYLDRVHSLYRKPIWVTEFAAADWKATDPKSIRFTPDETARFMREALPALERTPYIERFSWFSFRDSDRHGAHSALFDAKGKLTELGRLYADH
ncbi:MAG: glycoside hydrolase family protein [Armatimonadota bacterium]